LIAFSDLNVRNFQLIATVVHMLAHVQLDHPDRQEMQDQMGNTENLVPLEVRACTERLSETNFIQLVVSNVRLEDQDRQDLLDHKVSQGL